MIDNQWQRDDGGDYAVKCAIGFAAPGRPYGPARSWFMYWLVAEENGQKSRLEMKLGSTELLKAQALGAWALCFFGLLAATSSSFGSDTAAYKEYQVKAQCLLSFAKYVDWPTEAFVETNTPITVGVIGDNKFGDDLRYEVEGRVIGGRRIDVMPNSREEDWPKCQVLFISASEKWRQAWILKRLRPRPVLTVGESDRFTEDGGVINLTKRDGKVGFEVDLKSAREAGLGISSKLLKLADQVRGKK
jgi:hypothetical protein